MSNNCQNHKNWGIIRLSVIGELLKFLSILVILIPTGIIGQTCTWGITTAVSPSTCAANGSITVSLTGNQVDTARYTLFRNDTIIVSSNSNNVFSNIASGTYKVEVNAYCGTSKVVQSVTVTVTGSYVPPHAQQSSLIGAFDGCNTGTGSITVTGGVAPYNVTFTQYPSVYTGTKNFSVTNSGDLLTMGDLNYGSYTLHISDNCNSSFNQVMPIDSLGKPSSFFSYRYFAFQTQPINNGGCTQFQTYFNFNAFYYWYELDQKQKNIYTYYLPKLKYAVTYNNNDLPYKFLSEQDTVQLNNTYFNSQSEKFNIKLKLPCLPDDSIVGAQNSIFHPFFSYYYSKECSSYGIRYSFPTGYAPLYAPCFPIFLRFVNQTTKQAILDTMYDANLKTLSNFQYGIDYRLYYTTSDGYTDTSNTVTLLYSNKIAWQFQMPNYSYKALEGDDNTRQVDITMVGNFDFPQGAQIKINSGSYLNLSTSQYLYPFDASPGNYQIYYQDACNVRDTLNFNVANEDVIHYFWDSIHIEKVCGGVKIKPYGHTANGSYNTTNMLFKIVAAPTGFIFGNQYYDIKSGDSMVLSIPGQYEIAMGCMAASNYVHNYSSPNGNGKNVYLFNYIDSSIGLDPVHSIGWVCPGTNDSLGNIYALGINGISPYTYAIYDSAVTSGTPYQVLTGGATEGTLGVMFVSNGNNYKLIKNRNYNIKVSDACGSSTFQGVKVLDLATAQIATTDKSAYCEGESIQFRVLDLPYTTMATLYKWTGPNGFINTAQNPTIPNCTTANAGTYRVAVATNLCGDSIINFVTVSVHPMVTVCYSAITDTVLNPYSTGLTGNFRAGRSFSYFGNRAEADPLSNAHLRSNGTFASFSPYWSFVNGRLVNNADTTKWVWNSAQTMYNLKGLVLENKDPLGRYNSGLYGYNSTLPIAVVQNSQYKEAAFDGFEDYGYQTAGCEEGCTSLRHWDFSPYSTFHPDSTQSHSGKYSMRLGIHDTLTIGASLSVDAFSDPTLAYTTRTSCNGNGLQGIHGNQGALLPNFSPLRGKKMWFSAWVKEGRDCKCESYTGNKVVIHINNVSGSFRDIPIYASGKILDGWQRYEQAFDVNNDDSTITVSFIPTDTSLVYFDDVRMHPFNANMKSFVYNPVNLRLMAELDENNYATFYEYDDDGTLVRVKKETEKGIMTIKETRTSLLKNQ